MPSAQLLRFGLEDRCRERGPRLEAMVRFELTQCCLQDSRSASWSYIALNELWSGREADAPLRTPRSKDSLRSARMSHAPMIKKQEAVVSGGTMFVLLLLPRELVPKEGLKPSASGL